jgi:hypothetical protein
VQKIGSFIQTVLTPLVVLMIGGVVAYDHFSPRVPPAPTEAVDGKALGRAYAPVVASCLSEGWFAAADALEQGKSVPEAQAALHSAWQSARTRDFSARVVPEFARVLPEGTEPTDPARRAEVVRLWRDFASGLKGGL